MGQNRSIPEGLPQDAILFSHNEMAGICGETSVKDFKRALQEISRSSSVIATNTWSSAELVKRSTLCTVDVEINRVPDVISFTRPVREIMRGRVNSLERIMFDAGCICTGNTQLTACLEEVTDAVGQVRRTLAYDKSMNGHIFASYTTPHQHPPAMNYGWNNPLPNPPQTGWYKNDQVKHRGENWRKSRFFLFS